MFVVRKIGQFFIIQPVVEVKRIKPEEAQVSGKAAQVVIQQELDRIRQGGTQPDFSGEIEVRKDGKDSDMFARLHYMIEIHWNAICQNEIYFCVGYALCFDQVLDRLIAIIDRVGERVLPIVRRQEVVEVGVETEECFIHCYIRAALLATGQMSGDAQA